MDAQLPLVSELATTGKAVAYAKWLNRKVAASLADERPTVSHDEAMKRTRKVAKAAKASRKAC